MVFEKSVEVFFDLRTLRTFIGVGSLKTHLVSTVASKIQKRRGKNCEVESPPKNRYDGEMAKNGAQEQSRPVWIPIVMIRVWNDIFGLSEFSLSETAHERSSTRYVNLALFWGGRGWLQFSHVLNEYCTNIHTRLNPFLPLNNYHILPSIGQGILRI